MGVKHWDYQRIHGLFSLRERDIVLSCNSLSKTFVLTNQWSEIHLFIRRQAGNLKALFISYIVVDQWDVVIDADIYAHTHTEGERKRSKLTSF